ncbi:class I SAM-dependent methyltransferase [Skermanella mucosa]|uniref:class I SAM-dependent methyltransferase n=1 Tax=Skermanella mucosa TaxID=1789672 RepID=UPI00192C870E|nr:class I SAM-dependent methyltransferase [Skermanella mucosa]UEM20443.1 class I SAM-dependent methyltransferase [Skermanella mucosa]
MTASPKDRRIQGSWHDNAGRWTAAVRSGAITSRRAGTDSAILGAIVEAVARLRPACILGHVLDLGCGEGWLTRRLRAEAGCRVTGADGSAELVRLAREADPDGRYLHADYAAIAADPGCLGGPFDAVAANFALLDEDLSGLLRALAICAPAGSLVIQTVHPWTACGDGPYADGWREESFAGFGGPGGEAWSPMPWYFRTLETWIGDLRDGGWRVADLREPADPQTGRPLSLVLTCAAITPERRGRVTASPREAPASAP